jgi:hypothetical protein
MNSSSVTNVQNLVNLECKGVLFGQIVARP